MHRVTITSVSSPFEIPIREACESAHPRMMKDCVSQYSVCIAPSLDGNNPRIWIGKYPDAPAEYVALTGIAYKGAWSLEHNYNAIKERMRGAPIYATAFKDSQGYAAVCTANQLEWMKG